MTPTNKLRWKLVEHSTEERLCGLLYYREGHPGREAVLQQWWEKTERAPEPFGHPSTYGEWRDIPIEEEK